MPKIRFKRGLKANLPILDEGEPGFTTDTEELFVGSKDGNIEFAKQSDLSTTNANVATNTANIATNTAAINAIGTINANAELVAARGTYPTLAPRLDNVDVSLADIMQNRIYLKDYPRLSGETNDNGIFTRAFANIVDNTEIIFEKGKSYSVTVGLPTINKNNITITGNGATINSSTTGATNVLSFGQDTRTTLSQSVTVTKGSPQFTMTDVTGINVGDIVMFSNAGANGYSDGVYGEVVVLDTTNKIVTLSTTAHKSFTATSQYVCTAYRNIIVRGLTINCSTSQTDAGMVFYNIINAIVEFNKLEGNQGRRGIGFQGINASIQYNQCNNFFDTALIDNRTGYGVSVCGHNLTVYKNRLSNCKHTIASSDRRFYSTNLVYKENECRGIVDPALQSLGGQIIDMHANAEGVIEKNNLFNISSVQTIGMMVRSNFVRIENNTFYSVATNPSATIKGLVLYEYAGNDIQIRNNVFKGYYTYSISFESQWITNFNNIFIEGNSLEYGQIRTSTPSNFPMQNLYIAKNIISQDGSIQIANTVNNGRVKDNQIISAVGIWEPTVSFSDPSSTTILFEGNDLTNMGGGAECLRFYGNGNIIKNNRFKMSANGAPINNYNATATNLISDNIFVDYLGNTTFNNKVSVSDMQLTTTSATTVASLTPVMQNNFTVKVYYSVSGAPTTINITVTYTDHRGAQTQQLVNVTNQGTGSYLVTPIMINAKSTAPIVVTATAGIVNNINISATIIPD